MMKKVLSVETSCDDTCVALVREDGFVEQNLMQDQNQIHQAYGGILPEGASRNHSQHLLPLIDQVLSHQKMRDISLLAYTNQPGLLGSLLVGSVTVKTLSVLYKKPFLGVDHIEGHILSPFLHDSKHSKVEGFKFPYIVLVVSGGHTCLFEVQALSQYRLISQTLDDAAGEAFDKFARMIGLGYPGGVQVDQCSQKGELKYSFPTALAQKGNLNFSFSGLKTSASFMLQKMSLQKIQEEKSSLCASYQEAICNQILFKLNQCLEKYPQYERIALVGGVSANSRLRQVCSNWAQKKSIQLVVPPLRYCTDNAAMIGYTALSRFLAHGETSSLDLACQARSI